MWLLNRLPRAALWPYLLLGAVLWVCVLKSGVHATLAGVATGLMIPHVDKQNAIPDEIEHSPLETLEHALHPWVAYAILPVFAFANAGLVARRPADGATRWRRCRSASRSAWWSASRSASSGRRC